MSQISNTIPVSTPLQSTAAPKLQVPALGAAAPSAAAPVQSSILLPQSTGQMPSLNDVMAQMSNFINALAAMVQSMSSKSPAVANNLIPANPLGQSVANPLSAGVSNAGTALGVPSAGASIPSSSLSSSFGLAAPTPGSAISAGLSSASAGRGSGAGAASIGYDPDGATAKTGIVDAAKSTNEMKAASAASQALGQRISNLSASLNVSGSLAPINSGLAALSTPTTASALSTPQASVPASLSSAVATPAPAAAATPAPASNIAAASPAPAPAAQPAAAAATPQAAGTLTPANSGLTAATPVAAGNAGGGKCAGKNKGVAAVPAPAAATPAPASSTPAPASASGYGAGSGTGATSIGYDPEGSSYKAGVSGTTTVATPAPAAATPAPAASGATFNQDDARNYVLSSTQGGTVTQEASVFAKYADPNSRFAKIGDTNEFDAVVEKIYAAQFAGYANGIDVVFNPGKDVNTIAANITQAQTAYQNLNTEAKLIADVAATYRGDFGNRGPYNHAALKDLLVSWGRQDLASQPLVGVSGADAQTIGAVVKALNEQPDQATRQAWMQQIFDFKNNTPSSPSGAVPDLANYQTAIKIVKSNVLDQLMSNYNKGVGTTGPINVA